MSLSTWKRVLLALALTALVASLASARTADAPSDQPRNLQTVSTVAPAYCLTMHNVGKMVLGVTNYAIFGSGSGSIVGSGQDCFTGATVPSCEYPKGSNAWYLYSGSFWIGAVKGEDTLVSTGSDGWIFGRREFNPYDRATQPRDTMKLRSIIDPGAPEFELAVSEQDLIARYTDSFTTGVTGLGTDFLDGRNHRPLFIDVTQRSYAWSYSYAEDFVLFDYTITNASNERLNNIYMGLYVDADVGEANSYDAAQDDVCGFLYDIPSPPVFSGGCDYFRDTVFIAWIADNDGDLSKMLPVPHITGGRVIRTPAESLEVSFNWWVGNTNPTLDFGPQMRRNIRDLGTGGKGTPEGDRNKYFFLRNKEFDYDQIFTASIGIEDTLWDYPNQALAGALSTAFDTRYLLSFGPFTLEPGESAPISLAYVAGEYFHTEPGNTRNNLIINYNPNEWLKNVSFEDLGLNAMWASWVYDNPGVDTDGDGTRGDFRICYDSVFYDTTSFDPIVVDTQFFKPDTIYYRGDGAPDFRGASPPPAPDKWVYPTEGKLHIRWNGLRSETAEDVFSHVADFEGYRVYLSRDDRAASYAVVASFDVEDYNKFVYSPSKPGGAGFTLIDLPFTREQLVNLYGNGNTAWDPEEFTPANPYRLEGFFDDSIFYFAKQDFNQSQLGISTPIRKKYPDAPRPAILEADSIPVEDRPTYLTEDGYFKYYEYALEIDNLLPTVPYFVNVTAFDFGSPQSGLGSLETSVTVNAEVAFPQPGADDVASQNLPVYVYPNPYRLDGSYGADGFEGRDKETRGFAPDRQRRIHFANLPPECTIRIYTLDGDLVREFEHSVDPSDPTAGHASWDLVTRNTQLVVSGIYYWTVEEPNGEVQLGKLVVIM
ncbi:MAG: hypothetical protein NDJ18_00280 [candidate division Zixibacteria bacterium]|nr:hypothetical protein [candidate division Zixibacteria bacterium]